MQESPRGLWIWITQKWKTRSQSKACPLKSRPRPLMKGLLRVPLRVLPARENPLQAARMTRQWTMIPHCSAMRIRCAKTWNSIETANMKDKIFRHGHPAGRDRSRDAWRTVERHVFPGYVLVNMILEEESWFVVRNTPGVTGFVGMGEEPTALRPEEVAQILRRMEDESPTYKVTYHAGDRVRIVDGPFNDFRGTVAEVNMERSKIRVMVNFFGRETPVELDFLQVEKA